MPRIPLYNKGIGPSIELASGNLGPRAQSGAFEAPGRALASVAGTATDIAFNFGMEERKREDNRLADEEYAAAFDKVTDFIRNDTSTSVEDVGTAFDKIEQDITARIDEKGYTSRRADLIKRNLNKVFLQGRFDAKNQAHKRGLEQSGLAFDQGLLRGLESLKASNPGSPQFRFFEESMTEGLQNHLARGLPSSFNPGTLSKNIENIRQNNTRTSLSESIRSATLGELDGLQTQISESGLDAPDQDVLRRLAAARTTELEDERVARFVNYIPIANLGDTDFDTVESVEFLIANAKEGRFGREEDLAAEWAQLSQEDQNKIEAAWSARLAEARAQVAFNNKKRDRQERDANENIYTSNKSKILNGDLSIADVNELGFTGVTGETYRDQLRTLIGRRATGQLLTDSLPVSFRETRDRVFTGQITSITQRFTLPSDPPEVGQANDGQGLSLLERGGTILGDDDVSFFENYLRQQQNAAQSDEASQTVRNLKLFDDFINGYKDIIIGNPNFAKLSLQSDARFYDFSVQMRKRFFDGIEQGKSPEALLNPRSDDFLILSNERWTPTNQELMAEIAASLAETATIADVDAAQEFAPPPPPAGVSNEDWIQSDEFQAWATGPNAPRYYQLMGIQ